MSNNFQTVKFELFDQQQQSRQRCFGNITSFWIYAYY